MSILLILFIATSCQAADFSSRPTNASLTLLYSTYKVLDTPVFMGLFGIWSVMASLSFGTSGDTRREIVKAFSLLTNTSKFNKQYTDLTNNLFKVKTRGVTVWNKNYLFIDNNISLDLDFKNMLIQVYETEFRSLNFEDTVASAKIANSLIDIHSNPSERLLAHKDFENTSLIMSNVLFFEGYWFTPFEDSEEEAFRNKPDMMYQRMKISRSHIDDLKATVMNLPFGDDRKYSMLVLKPDPNVSTDRVYRNFERITLKNILNKLENDKAEFGLKEVDVELPQLIKLTKTNMKAPLNYMGVHDVFDSNSASFESMVKEHIHVGALEYDNIIAIRPDRVVALACTPGIHDFTVPVNNAIVPTQIFFIIEKSTLSILFGGIFP